MAKWAFHAPQAPFEEALRLPELVRAAEEHAGPTVASAGVDRTDVRPDDGLVKVRFRDRGGTGVTVDLAAVAAMLLVGSGLILWLSPKAKL